MDLDHLTVPCRNKTASARLLAELLDVPWDEKGVGPFAPVYVSDHLTLDFDETDTPFLRCSGSLLSPTTFLTAGHCAGPDASSGTPQPAFARIWFGRSSRSNRPSTPTRGRQKARSGSCS